MSPLVLGAQMVRIEDGRKGVVALIDGERRIVWVDRGEQLLAKKDEQWAPLDEGRAPLRAEEKIEVALHADRALRAIDLHEPLKFWERPSLADEPYEPGLVMAIIAYLSTRA